MKKAALITGSSGLIGRELCQEYLSLGFKVYGIDKENGETKQSESFFPLTCDITQENEVQELFQQIPRLDVLINNAAKADPYNQKLEELELSEWNKVIATNLTSVFLMSKHAIPLLKKTKGSIINLSSIRHLMCEPDTEIYCSAKGGIDSLTKAMAISLGPAVRVNSISPGWIHNPQEKLSQEDHSQHPAGRAGIPQDVAKLATYLSSEGAGFVTGQDFIIDGGMTVKMIYQD
jgi:NAD(P)-dependent dehydrogenase (short-subunit alcohol dehydrogenase family)